MVVSSGFGEEFVGIDFGDKRLTKRVVRIAERFGKYCNLSIPAATDGRAEMEAAYRFMDNSKVSPEKIMGPHRQATLERIRQCDVALLVQDTTELDVTRPSQQVAGSGPLTHNSRHGSFCHPLVAFSGEGIPLGVAWYKHWARKAIQTNRTAAQKRADVRGKPITEKESHRWLEGVRGALDVANRSPDTQCIVIGDSESDIYEVLAEPRKTEDGRHLEIIVRASGDRNLEVEDGEDKLLARVRNTPCLFRSTIDISKRTQKTNVTKKSPRKCSRKARLAEVEVRATTVTIRSPRNSPRRPSLTYNVVLVEEKSPPDGEPPIQWLLITSLPVETIEDVQRIIHYYCQRWQIEIFFRTLKSGCRIQERYFETMGRLENCLAIYMVIAWKILYLCRLGQECPDLPCDIIFSDSEWKAVYTIVQKETPSQPPSINVMIRMIASLGGYVIRTTTNPGTQTLWLGLQRVHDLANAWDTFGPGCPDVG
jgi:hypothetical protein